MTDLDEQMVERVAKVLWAEDDMGTESTNAAYRGMARAAIREVLGSMVDLGLGNVDCKRKASEPYWRMTLELDHELSRDTPEARGRVFFAPEGKA